MIYLHKILPVFVLPVAITLLLLLAGIRFRRRSLIWAGVVVLWLCSMPLVGRAMIGLVEGGQIHLDAARAPQSDAIVVLSEGRVVAPGPAAVSEWHDADRFFGGMELFKAQKAPLIVFTGGAEPGRTSARLEGDILAEFARSMGVPAAQIRTTGRVLDTAEEAAAVASMFQQPSGDSTALRRPPRILLVTSAFHMPRARRQFEHSGMTVVPYPVDFKRSAGRGFSPLALLPTAEALQQTEMSMRELYGRLFYLIVN